MELKMYCVRDSKAEIYNNPFFSITHAEAERTFQSAVRDPKTKVGQYPEDFDLYYVGTYDDNTGKIMPTDSPQHIVKGINLVTQ